MYVARRRPSPNKAAGSKGFGVAPLLDVFGGCADERAGSRADQNHAPVPHYDMKHIHVRAVELQHSEARKAGQSAYGCPD
jgi:hypothetical protein